MPHDLTFSNPEHDEAFVFGPEQTESQDATEFVGSSGAIGEYDTGDDSLPIADVDDSGFFDEMVTVSDEDALTGTSPGEVAITDPLTGTSPGESQTPGSSGNPEQFSGNPEQFSGNPEQFSGNPEQFSGESVIPDNVLANFGESVIPGEQSIEMQPLTPINDPAQTQGTEDKTFDTPEVSFLHDDTGDFELLETAANMDLDGGTEYLPPLPYDNGGETQDLVGLSETGSTDSFDGLF